MFLGLFFMLQTTLWATDSYLEMKNSISQGHTTVINEEPTSTTSTEVSLDFGVGSMTIVLVLTSLLGLFFVRDELSVL